MASRNKKKIHRVILSAILILAVFAVFIFLNIISTLRKGEQTLSQITYRDIDISSIKNGTYLGEFKAGLVSVKVGTTVKNGKISDIKLIEHKNGKGSAAESMIDDIIAKQTTAVDIVSGATISSKIIRKAIENSLIKK